MKIREDIKVESLLSGKNYLGSGASKEAYEKDGLVYKVPRGRYMLQQGGFSDRLRYPTTMEEVDFFLEDVDAFEPALVWPLGQFAIELIVWEAIKQLESEGLEINCFARILDYYLDYQGVPVIVQEATGENPFNNEDLWEEMQKELKFLRPILKERFDIELRDVRDGNCGVKDGKLKLFDFGISTTTSLDSYGSYSDCTNDDYCEDEDYYC